MKDNLRKILLLEINLLSFLKHCTDDDMKVMTLNYFNYLYLKSLKIVLNKRLYKNIEFKDYKELCLLFDSVEKLYEKV